MNTGMRSLCGWLLLLSFLSPLVSQAEKTHLLFPDPDSPLTVQGELKWEGVQYLLPLPETRRLNNSQFLSGALDLNHRGEHLSWDLSGSAGTFVEFGSSTFTVSEVYMGTGKNLGPFHFGFGRKLLPWNMVDQEWELGVYQPIYSFDAIHPEVQGLTGLFMEWQGKELRLAARVSPLFVPTQGAPIENSKGELSAPSRFFKPPSGSTVIIGQPTTINYDLDVEPLDELLFHPGGSLLVGYGDYEEPGYWSQASYSYKPNPYLLMSFLGVLALNGDEGGQPEGQVTVSPYASYHSLWGGDFGWNGKRLRLWASALSETPEEGFYNEAWTRQEFSGLNAYAINVGYPLWSINKQVAMVDLGYLHIEGSESRTVNSVAGDAASLFDDRTLYRRAVRMRFNGPLFEAFGRPLSAGLKWLYEFEQEGILLSSEFRYLYQQSVALVLGMDIIGVPGASADDSSTGFLNQYRSNDRIYGGLSYVF